MVREDVFDGVVKGVYSIAYSSDCISGESSHVKAKRFISVCILCIWQNSFYFVLRAFASTVETTAVVLVFKIKQMHLFINSSSYAERTHF